MAQFFILMKQELLLTAIIFVLIFARLSARDRGNKNLLMWAYILLAINLAAGFFWGRTGTLFGNMFMTNGLVVFEKNVLNLGVFIISLVSYDWLLKHKHLPEFFVLMLSTLLGMFFMLSAQNVLMLYLGLELASIPLAALATFDLEKRRSSEAGMKYIMSSAFASAVLLFGISILYGVCGTLDYAQLANAIVRSPLLIFAFVFTLAGFGFKISAVPFHLWTADVYQGSPVAVTSYFSVISKGSMVFVTASVFFSVFRNIQPDWYRMVAVLSVASMVVGNLFALRQNNLKRFLAFSSITQVGYILLGLLGGKTVGSAAAVFFVLIYIFSNLAAFGVVAVIGERTGEETVSGYRGLYKTNKGLSWILAMAIFSLAGIPPTAGFFGKFFLVLSGAGAGSYALIAIAALNIVVSLFYYLRIIKAVFMDQNDSPIGPVNVPIAAQIGLFICLAGILITGLISGAYEYIHSLVKAIW